MITIGNVTSIPYIKYDSSNNKTHTYYTYVFEFLNDDGTPLEIITPKTKLEVKNKEDVKLNITNTCDNDLFFQKIKTIEYEIYDLIRNDYKYTHFFHTNGIENIKIRDEMKDNIYECINTNNVIMGTISIIGFITIQHTFEIVYTLEKIKYYDVLDEIFDILSENTTLIETVKEELDCEKETITIYDIKSAEEAENLQNEIIKLINE